MTSVYELEGSGRRQAWFRFQPNPPIGNHPGWLHHPSPFTPFPHVKWRWFHGSHHIWGLLLIQRPVQGRVVAVVTKSCQTLCDPTDGSPAGSSVLHCLPEFAETHAHWVDEGSEGRTPETDGVMPQASALGRTRCDVGISQGPPHHAQGDSSIFERNFFLYHAP